MKNFIGKAEWVWIDCVTHLPLSPTIVEDLKPFKTCLVCPERWGRPQDIPAYRHQMNSLNFHPNAVMTSQACAPQWTTPLP
ncbi:MAG: hypothetical protein O2901_16870 [Verrucomicrobia bacterium]|nr:hypothetical protein [Verrucomicrobiota bacterium]